MITEKLWKGANSENYPFSSFSPSTQEEHQVLTVLLQYHINEQMNGVPSPVLYPDFNC